MTKYFANKKGKSQLDKLLECLEEEGLQNLFSNKPYIFEEKDILVKLASIFELDSGNANNMPSLEFMEDKRSPLLDHSFEKEDPKGILHFYYT